MSARVSHRPGLRALLLGAALVAGAFGGGPVAAEESCFHRMYVDGVPAWALQNRPFFQGYVVTLRIAEHYRRLKQDPDLLHQFACECPGETVSWEETKQLVPDPMWTATTQVWSAEERRIRAGFASYRNEVVIPACARQKQGGN